jgi:diaminohydroxyphosphoribosylaminopyrimidine deaminase / 5-amino-6-(5-phosphoribosylamino)uracil reductase
MISPERQIELMNRALVIAAIPGKKVSPNPLVGCIIANDQGEILSEGYHEYFGGPHAEVNAINKLSDDNLNQAHLFVTLEPCNHYGKTPPCTELIINKRYPLYILL